VLFFVKNLTEKSLDTQLDAHAYFFIAEEHASIFTGIYRFQSWSEDSSGFYCRYPTQWNCCLAWILGWSGEA
jgi:hypothetical protein